MDKLLEVLGSTNNWYKQKDLIDQAIKVGVDIKKTLAKLYITLDNLQFLAQYYSKTIDPNWFLDRIISAYTTTEEEKILQKDLADQQIKAGAKIREALKNTYPSIKKLQFLAQYYSETIDPNWFLGSILNTYTATEEEKILKKDLFLKTLDSGVILTRFDMLNFNSMELMFAYQNRVINPNNVKKLLQHLLKIMAASESINKELEEAALSIITKYDIPVPIEVAYLPFNSLQKFMKLPQYYLTCDMAAELLQLDSPNFSYPNHITNYKYKNLESKDSGHIKIPPILHHIWLTDPNNPQPIRSQDVANAIETNRLFQSSTTHQWQQIIWVHNKTNLLSSIKQLSNTSIVVKEYHTLAPHLLNYDLVEQHSKLFRWGIASDTLRYDLVRYMGGVYADINFIFNRVPDIEINRFDFFSTSYSMSNLMAIDNFFFAAKPDHPVIARVQDTVRDNLIYPSFSLATIYNASLASFTDYATAAPIGDGYFKAAHQNDNIDVIFPKPPRTCELDSSCSSTSQAAEAQDQLIFNLMNICPTLKPDLMLKIQQEEYAITHGEMCAVPHNIIGIDSTDGRTWDNQ